MYIGEPFSWKPAAFEGCNGILSVATKETTAHGAILNGDLTLTPCYIVKQDNIFAHGETLREAMEALRDKLFEDMPEDERNDDADGIFGADKRRLRWRRDPKSD